MTNIPVNKFIHELDRDFLISIIPEQGCIELQRDQPLKIHDWHEHTSDETLLVLDGNITFSVPQGDISCRRGDYINLSAGTRHRSRAGKDGCIYVIAFRTLNLP